MEVLFAPDVFKSVPWISTLGNHEANNDGHKYGSVTMCLYFTETAEQYIKTVVEPILSPELFDKYFENGGDVIENAELFMKENCVMFIE